MGLGTQAERRGRRSLRLAVCPLPRKHLAKSEFILSLLSSGRDKISPAGSGALCAALPGIFVIYLKATFPALKKCRIMQKNQHEYRLYAERRVLNVGTISNRPIDGEGIPKSRLPARSVLLRQSRRDLHRRSAPLAAGVARRRIQPAERTAFVYIVIYWFNHISAFLTHPARGWGSEHRRTIDNRPYNRSPYFAD